MEFNTFLLGLLICFLLSFLVGLERQVRRRSIGLRTMILVAIGSYIFVSFSFMITGYQTDVSRIAAQVVAGIGFLGAGVIIKDNAKNKIRGLTTAATLWCDAGIGILCAGGFIKEATVAALVVLFSNVILRYINTFVNNKTLDRNINETFLITLNVSDSKSINSILEYVVTYVAKNDHVSMINYNVDGREIRIELSVSKNEDRKIGKFVSDLVANFSISKYEYKKTGEVRIEEDNDEL